MTRDGKQKRCASSTSDNSRIMSRKQKPSLNEILKFYETRGYHYAIGPGKCPAILVVDFSNAFTHGETDFPGGDFTEEIRQTRRLLDLARTRSVPIFYTAIAYDDPEREAGLWGKKVPWLRHCKTGTRAVAIDDALAPRPEEPVIVKKFPSAFFETDLDVRLSRLGVDTIVLAGCTTSVCIRATAIDAMQHGYRTLLVAEALADFHDSLHVVHLRDMDARYADVVSVEDVMRYLSGFNRKV
jgi:maleamate amidohydrolase